MRGPVWLAALVLLGAAYGCSDDPSVRRARAQRTLSEGLSRPAAQGVTVARVGDGHLTVEDLEVFWARHPNMAREQALEALIEETLLAQRGLAADVVPEGLVMAESRGLARAWLDTHVEGAEVSFDEALMTQEIERRMLAQSAPRGYQASHLLVLVPQDAPEEDKEALFERAREVLDGLLAVLPEQPTRADLEAAAASERAQAVEEPLAVVVNAHLRFPDVGLPLNKELKKRGWIKAVEEFTQATRDLMDEHPAGGARTQPVRTQFGWHVIVGERVLKGSAPERAEVEEQVRAEVRTATLQRRFKEELEPLLERTAVTSSPELLSDE